MVTGFDLLHSNKPLQKHWIKRAIAYLVDFLISSLVVYLIFYFLAVRILNPDMLLYFPMTAGLVQIYYSTILEYKIKKTIGKHIMSLKVEHLKHRFEIPNALIRNFSKLHGIFVIMDWLIGMLSEGDPRQRYLDRLSETTIKAEGEPLHVRDFIEDHLFKDEKTEETTELKNEEKETCRECGGELRDIGKGKARCRKCGRIQ